MLKKDTVLIFGVTASLSFNKRYCLLFLPFGLFDFVLVCNYADKNPGYWGLEPVMYQSSILAALPAHLPAHVKQPIPSIAVTASATSAGSQELLLIREQRRNQYQYCILLLLQFSVHFLTSCNFCISIFNSINPRISQIVLDHLRFACNMSHFARNTSLQGLSARDPTICMHPNYAINNAMVVWFKPCLPPNLCNPLLNII